MKSPKPLNELINQNKSSNSLSLYRQKSEFFIKIQHILSEVLGNNIAQNVIVSNYKNSIVYFESHSPSVATGFKMQQSKILSQLRSKLNPGLVTIEIKVSPNTTQAGSKIKQVNKSLTKEKKKKHIPDEAIKTLQSIADNANEQLKEKINRLIQHKKNSLSK